MRYKSYLCPDAGGRHCYQREKPTSQIDSPLYRHVLRHGLVVSRRVDVAGGINNYTFGRWGGGIRVRMGNERCDRPVSGTSDSKAAREPWIQRHVRLGIGDVDDVIAVDPHPAWPAELRPFFEERSILSKELNPIVLAVPDKQPAPGIEREGVGCRKFSRTHTLLSPCLDKRPVLRELHDARVRPGVVSVADEDVTIESDCDGGRSIERVRTLAGYAGRAQPHHDFSVRAELDDLMPFSVRRPAVSDPQIVVVVDGDAVRKDKDSCAEALHDIT